MKRISANKIEKRAGAKMCALRACTRESVFNHLSPLRSIGRTFKAPRDVLFHGLKPRRLWTTGENGS